MESLRANRMLMFAIGASGAIVVFLTSGAMPGLSQFFEIVDFPSSVSILYRLIKNSNIKFFILFEITVPRYVAHCADARYCWRLFTGSHLFIPIWGNASQVQSPQLLEVALTSKIVIMLTKQPTKNELGAYYSWSTFSRVYFEYYHLYDFS